ncbi:DASH complex subunit DAD1 [Tremella mesenterica]|uniref:DASH complex subunit DAD1 n=1 Tax=Tremella mesenterica TaxID=5217 RepID=A0A4Q1BFE6_TREME|nr:uncharacterized protein TREMEDRAFT_33777 [Tremella mesenterica DSM 1558]EIW67450.1 hypothetical protein TREMEDRAFT_33777 [Tremella mesenterica DSM 1558]RXK34991.1 DASH complex subunit DAD1 [Tremella mesenterica]
MSLSRPSTVQPQDGDPEGFFDRERDRLVADISTAFEELMTHTNVLNRKLEEVFGVGKEFTTVASLWGKFNALIREQRTDPAPDIGVPGTGGQNFAASVARS